MVRIKCLWCNQTNENEYELVVHIKLLHKDEFLESVVYWRKSMTNYWKNKRI